VAVAAANRPKPNWHGFIELERVLQWQLTCRERPGVLPLFVDGDVRRRKAGVSKHAHCNGDETGCSSEFPVNRRGANRTEIESGRLAAIAEPRPLRRAPLDCHGLARKARLRRKDTAGAFLAFEAMATVWAQTPQTKHGEFRTKLHTKAKAEPTFRFSPLYDKSPWGNVLTETLRLLSPVAHQRLRERQREDLLLALHDPLLLDADLMRTCQAESAQPR